MSHKRQKEQRGPVYVVKVTEKGCPKCGVLKPASQYHRKRTMPDGLQQICKACRAAYDLQPEQREKNAARKADWYIKHAEEQSVARKAAYEANPEPVNAKNREHYRNNKEAHAAANKARYERNKGLQKRKCICGGSYYVRADSRRYFCSNPCRRKTRWNVARFIVDTLHKVGISIRVTYPPG